MLDGLLIQLGRRAESALDEAAGAEGFDEAGDVGGEVRVRVFLFGGVAEAGEFEGGEGEVGEASDVVPAAFFYAAAAEMIEDQAHGHLFGQGGDGGGVVGNEMHLDFEAEIGAGGPGAAHGGVGEVAVLEGAGFEKGLAFAVHGMNSQGNNALGPALGEFFQLGRGGRVDGIEKAGALEESSGLFVGETVFEVAMVVLIGFGMDDDGVLDVVDFGEVEVGREGLSGGPISGGWMVREACRFEEVQVGLDGSGGRVSERGEQQ